MVKRSVLISKTSRFCGRKNTYLIILDGMEEIEMLGFTGNLPYATCI